MQDTKLREEFERGLEAILYRLNHMGGVAVHITYTDGTKKHELKTKPKRGNPLPLFKK